MRAIGIILAGGNAKRMRELSDKRAVAAMPVGGEYRAIDFALSNMSASGIRTVAVLTQYNSRSLNKHLSSSKWWDFGRKQGGLFVFNPTITPERNDWERGTADAMARNLDFLKASHEPYAVIAPGEGICRIDFNKVLEYHIEKRADITVVCTDLPAGEDPARFGFVRTDSDGRITDFEEKPLCTDKTEVSCGIYVIRRRHLIDLLEKCKAEGRSDFVQDILCRYLKLRRIYAFPLKTYWSNIADVEAYYRTNMAFLREEIRAFFGAAPGISTRASDLPPAKYNEGCTVRNSLVSSGCVLNGTVENSLLFRDVTVGNGCVIRNSIVLNNVYIGDNTVLENCIVESRDVIRANSRYMGTPEEKKIVIVENDRFAGQA